MFGIIANLSNKDNYLYFEQIREILTKLGESCTISKVCQDRFGNYVYSIGVVDFLIVLGGDGTVLQAIQNSLLMNVPIIAINTGSLGFLAENDFLNIEGILKNVLQGNYEISKRSLIEVYKDEILIDTCLNDIVINREGFSRIVSIDVFVDDILVNTYRGDGIIFSTATGSTGYNLSLNGPILSPKCDNMIITPIANHSFFSRSIVLSKEDIIKVKILESRKSQNTEAILTCDGRRNENLCTGDELMIKMSKKKASFIKVNDKNFFEICKDKLF